MTARRRDGAARAAVVALAPVVVLVAHVSHPYIAVLPDAHAIADAVHTSPTRWAVVHLLTAVGVALVALAFLAVRAHLRDAGEDRLSSWGLPLVLFGSAVYGLLPGLEFAPLAAAETGGDVAAVQEVLQPVFTAVLVTGAVTFAAGVLAFARAIADSRILDRRTTQVVVTALGVLALSRATPLGVVQFHVQALAALLAFWPLARVMWRSDDAVAAARPRREAAPV